MPTVKWLRHLNFELAPVVELTPHTERFVRPFERCSTPYSSLPVEGTKVLLWRENEEFHALVRTRSLL